VTGWAGERASGRTIDMNCRRRRVLQVIDQLSADSGTILKKGITGGPTSKPTGPPAYPTQPPNSESGLAALLPPPLGMCEAHTISNKSQ
jgi:hypothetical protein